MGKRVRMEALGFDTPLRVEAFEPPADPGAGKVKWLSIPRDFRVDLPGAGPNKINAAYYLGGQKGIITAVRELTGLPIHHIVVIKFNGVKRMVDDIGGITVSNPTAMCGSATTTSIVLRGSRRSSAA